MSATDPLPHSEYALLLYFVYTTTARALKRMFKQVKYHWQKSSFENYGMIQTH